MNFPGTRESSPWKNLPDNGLGFFEATLPRSFKHKIRPSYIDGKIPSLKLTAKAAEKWWQREPIRLPFLGIRSLFSGAIHVSFREGNPDHQLRCCGPRCSLWLYFKIPSAWSNEHLQLAGRIPRFIHIKTPKTSKTSMFSEGGFIIIQPFFWERAERMGAWRSYPHLLAI